MILWMKQIVIFFILKFSLTCIFAQEVKHNFLVEPQLVNCDSLKLVGFSTNQCIDSIRASKFRFDQSFRLTRKQGLQTAEYFSCDNKYGYLIVRYNGLVNLFYTVERCIWNQMISSSDPEGYYLEIKKQLNNFP